MLKQIHRLPFLAERKPAPVTDDGLGPRSATRPWVVPAFLGVCVRLAAFSKDTTRRASGEQRKGAQASSESRLHSRAQCRVSAQAWAAPLSAALLPLQGQQGGDQPLARGRTGRMRCLGSSRAAPPSEERAKAQRGDVVSPLR